MSLPAVKICMNELCGATTTVQWKRGWPMKLGGVATLCYACGTEYDNARFCERFHLNEPGWRDCTHCDKPVHCGCVVSKYLHECLDSGGISCINCIRAQPLKQSINEIPKSFSQFPSNCLPTVFTNRTNNITPITEELEKHQFTSSNCSKEFGTRCTSGTGMASSLKRPLSLSTIFLNQLPLSIEPNHNNQNLGSNSVYEPLAQQSLGFSVRPTSNGLAKEIVPSFKKEKKSCQLVLKQLKSGVSIRSKSNKGMGLCLDNRVGRQPGEGRGRSQLLPRYWPKMTDQELLQINGDLNSNCTITPLFEKILSASDAGRIGRLVLPKACAEMYFPRIDQSEGVPLKVQDIKGKEWTFQFRFWPNNNSRMYVLEGVTPCIQNLQLQAGDTVIFSRLDPEDKLVIGFRKATVPNPVNSGAIMHTENGNLPTNTEHEGTSNWDSLQPAEEKKTRNIGSKSKRLHMHSEDALELKLTWEQAQEYLRPPNSKPTVVMIDNYQLEEYDEPPVFGKKTIFTTNAALLQEQWVQCDSCFKWRKIRSDVLIPSKWTCSDNVSDPNRCLCSVPEEKGVKYLDKILKFSKKSKKQKVAENKETKKVGPTGLDALATLVVSGENGSEHGDSLAGPTTKHPRHRPGCSCIVCIQPPSGKGKHKPNCICNVCLTVRRRFKTLMLRKKKRLAEQEGEMMQKSQVSVVGPNDLLATGPGPGPGPGPVKMIESNNKGQELDLNCNPTEEQMILNEAVNTSRIPPVWQNMLARLVPNGTSDMKDGPMQTNYKSVEGS